MCGDFMWIKRNNITANNISYTLELSRWGITQGLPSNPYTTSDYTTANNNIAGINNALKWAHDNDYNHVVFPRGNYSVCYPNSINTQPNMTIDFNFSTLKVIYDSNNRSPFDTSNNPIYKFGGNIIQCTTPHTNIINLVLIGDRVERSWSNSDEVNMEFTTGILVGAGAKFSNIKNCNISSFMGDAIAIGFSPYGSYGVNPLEFGSIDPNTGLPITGVTTNSLRSINFMDIPVGSTGVSMIGIGYAPETTIPSGTYDIYFYTSGGSFLSKQSNIRTRDIVNFPKNTAKIKLAFEGNGTVDDGCTASQNPPYWAVLVTNGISDHVTVEDCEIHRNHRGGITVGADNVLIRRNYFHDNAMEGSNDLDGTPCFPDGTRYCINTEDNSGHNCRFIENIFVNTRLGIAIRGEYNEITGNEFRNCSWGIYLYYLRHCVIDNNYFYYAPVGDFEYNNFDRDWIISKNVFRGNIGLSFTGSGGSIASVINNDFYGTSASSPIRILNFSGNTFNNSTWQFYEWETICDSNYFINNSIVKISNSSLPIYDLIVRCTFINSVIMYQGTSQCIIRDSYFKESGYEYNASNATYSLYNCKLNNTTTPIITNPDMADIGEVHNILELEDCTVYLGNAAMVSSYSWGKIIINNTNVTYNLTADMNNALQNTYGSIYDGIDIKYSTISSNGGNSSQTCSNTRNVILVDNTLTNFSLTNVAVNIITYDSSKSYIRMPDIGNGIPTTTPQYIGQNYIDTTNKKVYIAVGTTGLSDWVVLN